MGKLDPHTVFDLEYFFQVTPDLLCVAGFDGYFRKINPAVSNTLGYTEEELFSSPISSFIHPDDQHTTGQKRLELIGGQSLLNFENRYITKDGAIVWLSWTSVPILRDKIVFAIAKNISHRKRLEENNRISYLMQMINDDHKRRFKNETKLSIKGKLSPASGITEQNTVEHTHSDQLWLNSFEAIVRRNAGREDLNLTFISGELALSQRQLFRRVDQILGITPNKLVRIIRLKLAWEAIASGKYRTIKEISSIAGYNSRSHFSKLFKDVYGIDVSELL
ncbi:GGDEF domain [Pedobacter sp. BAL39]|uniref:PAS domain S-box protein n=1 Tax=Pedobacter sp. BAL39 TaxID=391596 RepID=UPI0001559BA0|nr:PAS domain S-box protein [Pedobacter sp. BAL39]EDM37783.1 GGDEF domain [Pedobacter sp. BAL39]